MGKRTIRFKPDDVYYIYGLVDPRTDKVRYVGKSYNIKRRCTDHVYEAAHPEFSEYPESHKNRWIRQLISLDIKPIVKLLEETTYGESDRREQYWVKFYGRKNLTNQNDGGSKLEYFQNVSIYDYSRIKEDRNRIIAQLSAILKKNMYNSLKNWTSTMMGIKIETILNSEELVDKEKIKKYNCSSNDIAYIENSLLEIKNITLDLKRKKDTDIYIEFLTEKARNQYLYKDNPFLTVLDVIFDGKITKRTMRVASWILSGEANSMIEEDMKYHR